jgi:predicted DCC family thiol-disulfide oxidoreductase YuxK
MPRPLSSLFDPPAARLTVLFDLKCSFCRWTVRQLRPLDRHQRLDFISLQRARKGRNRPDLREVARHYPLRREIHVVRPDGSVRAGGDAMLEILDVLPGGWLLRPWTAIPGVGVAVRAVYRLIADHRALLAKLMRL